MRMRGIDGPGGVEISVFFLRGSDFFDERVEIRVELRVGMNAERVGSAFDHFEEVGIVEGVWRGTVGFARIRPPTAWCAGGGLCVAAVFSFFFAAGGGFLYGWFPLVGVGAGGGGT